VVESMGCVVEYGLCGRVYILDCSNEVINYPCLLLQSSNATFKLKLVP